MVNIQTRSGFNIKTHPRIWMMILGGPNSTSLKQECFRNNEVRIGWTEFKDGQWEDSEELTWRAKQMLHAFIYEMEPGDVVFIEKSSRSIDAIGVVAGDYEYDETLGDYPRKRKVEWVAKNIDEDMTQYLPRGKKQLARFTIYSVDYLGTDVLSEILKKYGAEQETDIVPEMKPYVFIIDEINRGNISKIFGELITLIEDKKRGGATEAMEAVLPYSGELFSVPNNVYILGTMNTADRSIALMDTALRRRFEFVEMMPNSEVLERQGVGTIIVGDDELNVARMLDVINTRIEYLFDREHTIGHAFFKKLFYDASLETLADIFEKNIIPLLQEYFYEDYEKIQLVLCDNSKPDEYKFILDRTIKVKDIFNGNPDIDLPEKGYQVQKEAFLKLESYKQIGRDL
ncbi:MAG: AAA family ATPase [Butyrivibrio sp.]|nr:AAA family ATPase [Butyrivibrio sp.]